MQLVEWKPLADEYGWRRCEQPSLLDSGADVTPVIFLQPLPPEVGTPLAKKFCQDGLTAVYAYPVVSWNDGAVNRLSDAIEWLLATHHPLQEQVVLVGCASGGILGRRYVTQGGSQRAAYLFMLTSAHSYSHLSYLAEGVYERLPGFGVLPATTMPALESCIGVNVYSNVASTIRIFHLPDAVNLGLPLAEEAFCRDALTYQAIREYLMGELWLVTVRLQQLTMHPAAADETRTGPFCFEINGWRTPFDGAFRLPLDTSQAFDLERTVLATIAFPVKSAGRAADVQFRLKDLSPPTGQRRKLHASLHIPLREDAGTTHVLADSLGSEVSIQVRCTCPQSILGSINA